MSFNTFLRLVEKQESFTFFKINHNFWEILSKAYKIYGDPVPKSKWTHADEHFNLNNFFSSGFVDELLWLLKNVKKDKSLHIGFELSAWPNDNNIIGTPQNPSESVPLLKKYKDIDTGIDSLILKKATMNGEIIKLFQIISKYPLLVVGPSFIKNIKKYSPLEKSQLITIDSKKAREKRYEIEKKISAWLKLNKKSIVLFQAGPIAPYWILRLRKKFPNTKFIDCGLALSIFYPDDILSRDWGKVYRKEIIDTYLKLFPKTKAPMTYAEQIIEREKETIKSSNSSSSINIDSLNKIKFIESKNINLSNIDTLLNLSKETNSWANRGPLWHLLKNSYQSYFGNLNNKAVIPCSSGGVALQAIINLLNIKYNKKLRWCVSSFSFYNVSRGALSDSIIIDSDSKGMISIDELNKQNKRIFNNFDGVILTNVFGLLTDFSTYQEWCLKNNKILIIDNAAGISTNIPNISYQAFSLHHTKPYGFGEGGLAVIDECDYELFLSLIEYKPMINHHKDWLTNGKLSDWSSAPLIDRLANSDLWVPLYQMQARRIKNIAFELGISLLGDSEIPKMSLPLIFKKNIELQENKYIKLGKYYQPLKQTKNTMNIYNRILNFPCHPDVKNLDRNIIIKILKAYL